MSRNRVNEPISLRPGQITAVQAQRKDPERVSVFVDGEFAFGLAGDVAIRNGLRKGLHLSVSDQEKLISEEQSGAARRLALEYIAHRARTTGELRRRLGRAGFNEDIIETTVDRMSELGYLDDAVYARTFVSERFASKGHGPSRLQADLRRKGVDPDTIRQAIDGQLQSDAVLSAAIEHARSRWHRRPVDPDPRRRSKKVADFLARRGFGYDVIRHALDIVRKEEAT